MSTLGRKTAETTLFSGFQCYFGNMGGDSQGVSGGTQNFRLGRGVDVRNVKW